MERSIRSITELVAIFSDCLRVLIPHVSKAGIEWEEGKSYDDWDAISQVLYSTVVAGSIAYAVEGKGFRTLAPYGMIMPEYADESLLFSIRSGDSAPFLKLERSEVAFDTAVFVELNPAKKPTGRKIREPLLNCQLQALIKSPGEQRIVSDVILE